MEVKMKKLTYITTDIDNFNKAYNEAKNKKLNHKQATDYAKIIIAIIEKDREMIERKLKKK